MTRKRNQKRNPRSYITDSHAQKLSPTEAEVLSLLRAEGLTVKQAAERRGCKPATIRKHKRAIVAKGFWEKWPSRKWGVSEKGVTNRPIRLHAEQWKIRILHQGKKYETVRHKCNYLPSVMDCKVRLNKDSIELYATPEVIFYGGNEDECAVLCQEYWMRVARRLENDLDIELIKDRSENWKLVKHEWAIEGCPLASEILTMKLDIRIYGEDGKLRFDVDKSKGLPESETKSVNTGKKDCERIRKLVEETMDGYPTPKEFLEIVTEIARYQRETTVSLASIIKLLIPPAQPESDNRYIFDYIG
jgi:hypothetical protein